MAFLEDLGRSNALSSVNNLMGKAMEMRQGEDQQAERAYTMGLQAEELGIHKATAEREATKFKFEADAMREKQRLQDIPYPVAKYLGADFANDPAKKMMYDKAKELGIIENIGGIDMAREKNFPAFKKYMQDDLEWTANLNATNMSRLQQRAAELESSIPGMKKPEEWEAAKGQLKTIYEQIGGLAKTQIAIDTEHQKKKDLEKTKAEGRIEGIQIGADARVDAAKVAAGTAEKRMTETERHNRAMESIRKAGGIAGGGKPTALMQNTEFLSHLGWSKEEAAKLLSGSKPMSRESYIGKVTSKIMSDEMISPDEKSNRVTEAISVYDTVIAKPGAPSPTTGKILDKTTAEAILKETGGDKNKAREIAKKRGYKF